MIEAMSDRKPLPTQVRQMGWISFWADVCSEMVYVVTPIFMTQVLKIPPAIVGNIEGIAEAIVKFTTGAGGIWSDRIQKRVPFVRSGYFLSAIGKPIMALATGWPVMLLARGLDRTGKGLRTAARDALITESVDAEHRGHAFGWHRSLDTWGAVAGIAVSFVFIRLLPGEYRTLFLVAALPGLIAVALSFRLKDQPVETQTKTKLQFDFKSVGRKFWWGLSLLGLFALANSSDAFLLVHAKSLGYSDDQLIGLYALHNIVFALSSAPAGKLSDKIGRWGVLAASWTLFAIAYAGMASLPAAWIVLAFAVYGLHVGIFRGVSTALIADLAPANARGSALGIFALAQGVLTIFANLITGVLYDTRGASTAFLTSAGIVMFAVILIPLEARITKGSAV